MAENSKIAWTDHTFNPWIGCQKVSDGCKNCYAEAQMTRKPRWKNTWGPPALTERLKTSAANWKRPLTWNKDEWGECPECGYRGPKKKWSVSVPHSALNEVVFICPDCGNEGMVFVRQRVFCASLADVFEDNAEVVDWRSELFELIAATPNLDWLILTKRPQNFFRLGTDAAGFTLADRPNVWLGTTIEKQEYAQDRIEALLRADAAVTFLSLEPMFGPIDLDRARHIDWVIAGGESSPNHRPFEWDWVRDVRDQCKAAGVPFFMKQGAGNSQRSMPEIPEDLQIREFPKCEAAMSL